MLWRVCAQSGVSTDAVRRRLFGGSRLTTRTHLNTWRETMTDPRVKAIAAPTLQPLFDIVIDLDPRVVFGPGPIGQRVLFGAAGGTFVGDDLHGEVVPGGGDWALFRSDGSMVVDVRLTLRTDDGALIYMSYGGRYVTPVEARADMADPEARHLVDPARYYFRTNPVFETGSERYAWVNDVMCVGAGYIVDGGIAYKVLKVA
jgi:hypothetical protein